MTMFSAFSSTEKNQLPIIKSPLNLHLYPKTTQLPHHAEQTHFPMTLRVCLSLFVLLAIFAASLFVPQPQSSTSFVAQFLPRMTSVHAQACSDPNAPDACDETEEPTEDTSVALTWILGVVASTPGTADGIGEWTILDETNTLLTLRVDEHTTFDSDIPAEGQSVFFEGIDEGNNVFYAVMLGIDHIFTTMPNTVDEPDTADEPDENDASGSDETGDDEERFPDIGIGGRVQSSPNTTDGTGEWSVLDDTGVMWIITVDDGTAFDSEYGTVLPAIEQYVWVDGIYQENGSVEALFIWVDVNSEINSDETNSDETNAEESNPSFIWIGGRIQSIPDTAGGIGEWTILDDLGGMWVVIVDASTELDPEAIQALPTLEQYVSVEGLDQGNNTVQALFVKLEEQTAEESGETAPDETDIDETSPDATNPDETMATPIAIDGFVVSVPSTEDGMGEWMVQAYDGTVYTIHVDEYTIFEQGLPAEGQAIFVDGANNDNNDVYAFTIRFAEETDAADPTLDDETANTPTEEPETTVEPPFESQDLPDTTVQTEIIWLSGFVASVPNDPAGIGVWTLRDDGGNVWTIEADASTLFEEGLPGVDARIFVEGYPTSETEFYAQRIGFEHWYDTDVDEWVWVSGFVESAPTNEDGVGTWVLTIQGEFYIRDTTITDGQSLSIEATTETYFYPTKPVEGQAVSVQGYVKSGEDTVYVDTIGFMPEFFDGILKSRPEDGIGTWVVDVYTILDEDNPDVESQLGTVERTIEVTEETAFDFELMPAVNQHITIHGYSAQTFNSDSTSDAIIAIHIGAAREGFSGVVEERPTDLSGVGEWVIQDDYNGRHTFEVNEETEFPQGVPEQGDSIYVEAYAQQTSAQETTRRYVALLVDKIDAINVEEDAQGYNRTENWIEFEGVVQADSGSEDKTGIWVMLDNPNDTDNQTVRNVLVDDIDVFKLGFPATGDSVFVAGFLRADDFVLADTIELLPVGSDAATEPPIAEPEVDETAMVEPVSTDQAGELWGVVLRAPAVITGTQKWIIESDGGDEWEVATTADTTFCPTVPEEDEDVRMFGLYQTDGTFLVKEMAQDTFDGGTLIVELQSGVDVQDIVNKYHVEIHSTLFAKEHIYVFETPDPRCMYMEKVRTEMAADTALIQKVELNYRLDIPINDAVQASQYRIWHWWSSDNTSYINQDAYTQVGFSEQLVSTPPSNEAHRSIVAVLDTGLDMFHPAWTSGQVITTGLDLIDCSGIVENIVNSGINNPANNAPACDNLPLDDDAGSAQGHGTHVAGIIAKIAPHSKILPVRVLDGAGRGEVYILAYAIRWAVDQGADVINISLGTGGSSFLLDDAVKYANDRGVLVVAAAGNDNSNEPSYPAAQTEVIGVTSVDANSQKAPFANFGEWVDMAAPGVGIVSTLTTGQGSGYGSADGTSMSTPFVSAAVALMREKSPRTTNQAYNNTSATTLRNMLESNGTMIQSSSQRTTGLGRLLNIPQALNAVIDSGTPTQRVQVFLPLVTR
ncbi:MAG: S8 family serine peptidase [Chloroflexota bacterium]